MINVPSFSPTPYSTALVTTPPAQSIPNTTFSPGENEKSSYFTQAKGAAKYRRERGSDPLVTVQIIVIPYGEPGKLALRQIMAGSMIFTTNPASNPDPRALGAFTVAQINDMLYELHLMAIERARKMSDTDPLNILKRSEKEIADETAKVSPTLMSVKNLMRLNTKRGILDRFTFFGFSKHNMPDSAPKQPAATMVAQGKTLVQDVWQGNLLLGDHAWVTLKRRPNMDEDRDVRPYGAFAFFPVTRHDDRPVPLSQLMYRDPAGYDQIGVAIYVGYVTQVKNGRPSASTLAKAIGIQTDPSRIVTTKDSYLATTQLPYVEIHMHQHSSACIFASN